MEIKPSIKAEMKVMGVNTAVQRIKQVASTCNREYSRKWSLDLQAYCVILEHINGLEKQIQDMKCCDNCENSFYAAGIVCAIGDTKANDCLTNKRKHWKQRK